VAAGSKPPEEFGVYDVELAEPGGEGLWLGVKCVRRESIDGRVSAGIGVAESVSIGALSLDTKPDGIYDTKPVGVDDTAFLRELGTEPHRAIRQPAINSQREYSPVVSEREHTTIKSKRQHTSIDAQRQPTVVITKREPAQFIRVIRFFRQKRVQWGRRGRGVNEGGELPGSRESRGGRRG